MAVYRHISILFPSLAFYTGTAEQSEDGFLTMFLTVLIVDAVAYLSYCYFLCKKEEDMSKLWFVFILAFVLVSTPQLLHPLADDDGTCSRYMTVSISHGFPSALSAWKGRFFVLPDILPGCQKIG